VTSPPLDSAPGIRFGMLAAPPAKPYTRRMERRFPRDIAALDEVFDFVTEYFASAQIAERNVVDVCFIVEEIFTNMVKYNTEGTQDISVQLSRANRSLTICLTDFDVHDFDITKLPEVDTTQPPAERKVGGLGIHLVKRVAEDVTYEYENRNSKITVVKRLED
jgi:anti-sigma regulatory factor (Ser/Thr protein kinase)